MRYYVAQFVNGPQGWIDIEGSASLKKKQADAAAEKFAHEFTRATRAIKKSKGWKPEEGHGLTRPSGFCGLDGVDLSKQISESRELKK